MQYKVEDIRIENILELLFKLDLLPLDIGFIDAVDRRYKPEGTF